jgi:hypothetical protein
MPSSSGLRHFKDSEILIGREQARNILIFFFGNNVPPADTLTNADIAFAQALLLEAIDKSYAMGYVQAAFDAFYMKIPTDFTSLVKDFAKKAAKNWFDHAAGKDLSNPKIYRMVLNQIQASFGSVWQMRMQGLDLDY